MKVLYLVEATIAGVRHHVQTLATHLQQQGYGVVVGCPTRRQQSYGEDAFVTELQDSGVRVVPLPLRRDVGLRPDTAALAATLRLLRSERFDLVHTHSSKAGFVGRVAARLSRTPVIHTPNSLHFLGQRSAVKRQLFLRAEQVLGQISDRVIAVSAGEQALIVEHHLAPASRVVCIPNGVDVELLVPSLDRASFQVPQGVPLIGTLARLEMQKNPQLFVQAAALLLKALPEAHFVWCGDGSLRGAAEELAADLGIAGRCHWLGYRADALALLAALDVFWLTSHFEGLPHALLEALALGRPSVATAVVGSRDVIAHGRNGILVPPSDPAALARATLDLLASPIHAAALAEEGRALVHSRYSTSRMLAATTQLYHEVAQTPLYVQEPGNREVSIEHQPRYVGDA